MMKPSTMCSSLGAAPWSGMFFSFWTVMNGFATATAAAPTHPVRPVIVGSNGPGPPPDGRFRLYDNNRRREEDTKEEKDDYAERKGGKNESKKLKQIHLTIWGEGNPLS